MKLKGKKKTCEVCGKKMRAQRNNRRACDRKCQQKLVKRIAPEGMAWCSDCQDFRSLNEFYIGKSTGLPFAYCRRCKSKRDLAYRREKAGLPIDAIVKPGIEFPIGTKRMARGYVMVKVGSDKNAHHRAHKNGWVYEHILVAETKYNIKVTRDFTVHHRNGQRDDNRPENLELRYGNHGKGADVMAALMLDEQCRADAVRVLTEMGFEVFWPGDARNK